MRKPLGNWTPPTDSEMDAATDFTDEALQAEVERDTVQWVKGIEQTEQYEVGGTVQEVGPDVLNGLVDSKPEE